MRKTMRKTTATMTRNMKKFGTKREKNALLLRLNNAVDPAAPASAWGKGVPGKGGATTNYGVNDSENQKGGNR